MFRLAKTEFERILESGILRHYISPRDYSVHASLSPVDTGEHMEITGHLTGSPISPGTQFSKYRTLLLRFPVAGSSAP